MLRARLTLAALLLSCAGTAFAMERTTWDFRGRLPVSISVQKLTTVEQTPLGLHVATTADGFLVLPPLTARADVLHIRGVARSPVIASLLWQTPALATGEYYQSRFILPSNGEPVEQDILLHNTPEWTWSAPMLGLAFPAGTNVLIEGMEWRQYSALEKLWNGIVSFWTPDQFRLYSINFLWGPLIGTTPEARATLYETLPPQAWSATRIFYTVLVLAAVLGGLWAVRSGGGSRRLLATIGMVGAALWIFFDARMTQEILSYVLHDWNTYVLAADSDRVLRTHATLYDVLAEIKEVMGHETAYVLVTEDNTPFFSNVRYALYPAVPYRPTDNVQGIRTTIVLARADVTVVNGVLQGPDGPLTQGSGSIIKQFDDSSFIFQIAP